MASGLWLWRLTKLGVVGGAVYVTVTNGVWSRETGQLRSLIDQYRGPLVHVNQDQQKGADRPWGETWNSGVQTVFKAFADSPDTAKQYTQKAISSTKDLIRQKS